MIPKVIHYCWFGGKTLPDSAKKCIQSWEKYFPEYDIKEWNESNFDINICIYVKEAYENKKYAFVSDYVRFWVLYNYGGVYFDTDVEVINNYTDILKQGPFIGCEKSIDNKYRCNAGLGMSGIKGDLFLKKILDYYNSLRFVNKNGELNQTTVVDIVSHFLEIYGFNYKNEMQKVIGYWIYPTDFFCPIDYKTGKINVTDNTRSIHWFSASWKEREDRQHNAVKMKFAKYGIFGQIIITFAWFILKLKKHLRVDGVIGTIRFVRDRNK